MLKRIFKYTLLMSVVALSGPLLSGCGDNQSSADKAQIDQQAAIDKHNAELARKNTVRSQIK
ncbi:hypothetical protein [Castellaniella sp.]|uniref:hypothetical protein n=1 Tax=Castellaniella sp. TaxID=1955812 RepID=UPI002AFE2154|nr:hypothetical protein [Castellaniella sp.]